MDLADKTGLIQNLNIKTQDKFLDLYFNCIHISNLKYLCNVKSYSIKINSSKISDIYLCANSINKNQELCIALDNINELKLHGFNLITQIDNTTISFNIHDIAFDFLYIKSNNNIDHYDIALYTDEEAQRDISIAIISTTFNRKQDITKLINTFEYTNTLFPILKDKVHLYIVNNGEEYDVFKNINNKNIKYIKNEKNTGGSGGFSKGTQEALKHNFTNLIYMDDDAQIYPETIFRTYNLLRYLTDINYNQIISGSMFERENPSFCHCMLEGVNNSNFNKNICGRVNFSSNNIVFNTLHTAFKTVEQGFSDNKGHILYKYPKDKGINNTAIDFNGKSVAVRPYAAWWYCVLPVSLVKDKGLPFPLFYRGDDVEYSLRANRKVLFFNGLCIWHPRFVTKKTNFTKYLGLRNYHLVLKEHFDYYKIKSFKLTIVKIYRALKSHDRDELNAIYWALHDLNCSTDFSKVCYDQNTPKLLLLNIIKEFFVLLIK